MSTERPPGPGDEFALPIGTVTFLLTDVEGSTLAWQSQPELMGPAIARHYEILDTAVASHGGIRPQEQGEGDSIVAAFARASDALRAAVDAQIALGKEPWAAGTPTIKVRMAVHAGEAQMRNEANYVGQAIIRTARLRAIAHGGQIVVSQAARDLAIDQLGTQIEMTDLGVHRLKDLARPEHVWQVLIAGAANEFPPLRSLDHTPNNLPMALSTFIGRQDEIDVVAALCRTNRLVTVTGSGGAGKTRLAQQVGATIADRFIDGAWWVELAPLDEDVVVRATAALVSVKDPEQLVERLADRSLLLIFDNCEHVLDTVAPLINRILVGCPNVRILATSRGPLDIPGEVTWRVPPLSIPAPGEHPSLERLAQFDAVRLFLDRARRARSNFALTNDNGPAVAEICSRLDGIPLAIELAAARTKSLTPQSILAGLEDSLRLLTSGSRLLLPRQQTLEASIAWSHDLLGPSERALLRRLSVFAGGCTLEAAEAVCADGQTLGPMEVLDGLERLIDQSLVRLDEEGPRERFHLLETVRQFGAARLREADEQPETAERHATFFVNLATTAIRCEGPDEEAALAELSPEHPNFDSMLRYLREHRPVEELVRTVLDLTPMWGVGSGQLNGVAWCTTALELIGASSSAARAQLLQARALCHYASGQLMHSYLDNDAAVRLVDDEGLDTAIGRARMFVAPVAGHFDAERGQALWRQGDEELDVAGDRFGQCWSLMQTCGATVLPSNLAAATGALERAYEAATRLGNPTQIHQWAIWATVAAIASGDRAAGRAALEIGRRIKPNAPWTTALTIALEARCAADEDRPGPSLDVLEAAHGDYVRRNEAIATGILDMAIVGHHQRMGDFAQARAYAERHYDTQVPGFRQPGMILEGAVLSCALGEFDVARELLTSPGSPAVATRPNWVVGSSQVTCLVLHHQGEPAAAEAAAQQSLDVSVEHGLARDIVASFELLAIVAAATGSWNDTARLCGIVAAERERRELAGSFEPVRSLFDAAKSSARAALGDENFDSSEADGHRLELDGAVELVRRMRGERGRPTIGWTSLTPTERRVSDLVRDGSSNAEVARELLMGVETVKTHLSRVYAKLGVANRNKLAALPPPPTS